MKKLSSSAPRSLLVLAMLLTGMRLHGTESQDSPEKIPAPVKRVIEDTYKVIRAHAKGNKSRLDAVVRVQERTLEVPKKEKKKAYGEILADMKTLLGEDYKKPSSDKYKAFQKSHKKYIIATLNRVDRKGWPWPICKWIPPCDDSMKDVLKHK